MFNIVVNKRGELKKVGYKSINGLCQCLKRANKNCLKYGFKTQIMLILPIKQSKP